MSQLNLKHLRYFWVVASQGSITRASEVLHVTPQTISGQLRMLEESIGKKLFEKSGRNLVVSETGQAVYSYADEIFGLEDELQAFLKGAPEGRNPQLRVGVAMVVPKLIAYRVLQPVMQMQEEVRLVCHEAPLVDLLADLAVHRLDMVLADTPISPTLNVKAYNHLLGESRVGFFVRSEDARRYQKNFPHSLDGAPLLMPTCASALRRGLDLWLEQRGIKPRIVAEFEDRALMKVFGEGGSGVFTSPMVIETDVVNKYGVRAIAEADVLKEHFYVISAERHIKHPAVAAIVESAQALFSP